MIKIAVILIIIGFAVGLPAMMKDEDSFVTKCAVCATGTGCVIIIILVFTVVLKSFVLMLL